MKFELTKDFIDDLNDLIKQQDNEKILHLIEVLHLADIAEVIEELELKRASYLFDLLEEEISAEVLTHLEEDTREHLLKTLTSKEIAEELIENMNSDDAADVISALSDEKKEEVLSHIEDINQASDIVDLLSYPEDSAGGLMAKELIQVNQNWSVLRCVREMRRQAEDIENVYTIYVVSDDNILLGTLSLKRLLLTPEKTFISDIYNQKVISVKAMESNEDIANIMEKYDLIVLPVIDDLGRLIGRITIDDVVDVIKEEAEKDYQMASGISENIESSDSIFTITRARLPWLLIGLTGGIMGAKIMGNFELHEHIELTYFTPLIAAMGGNVGVQSAAIIVQGLAGGSLGFESIGTRLMKEMGVALINGLICSLIIYVSCMAMGYEQAVCLTVGISLIAVIIFAALFGTFVPLTLSKYKIDPALATGPFITTVNDILGLFIYFYIGKVLLGY